jgi:molybdopterin/thiamine biosynthesis adenylyltransferase
MRGKLIPGEIDEDRFDRSRRVGWIDMDSLSRSKCLVVGAGALGNEVVKNLVLSGFKRISVIDMDRVVRSNLNRCILFREEDAQRKSPKAEAVAYRAKDLDPSVDVEAIVRRIEDLDIGKLGRLDVAFGCLDNVATRLHLNAHTYHLGIPYIDGGTHGMAGRVQVVVPPSSPCIQCGMNRTHFKVMEKRYGCTGKETSFYDPKLPAEITTTSVVAAIQVREAIKMLSGRKEDCIRHVLYYNGLANSSEMLELTIDPQCPMHSPDSR